MLLSTLFFIQSSIKEEFLEVKKHLPDIVIQAQKAMMPTSIDDHNLDKIIDIYGVSDAVARVHGKYEFKQAKRVFEIYGIDIFENQNELFIKDMLEKNNLPQKSMFVSKKLLQEFKKNYYEHYFNFYTPALEQYRLLFAADFAPSDVDKQYLAVMSKEDAQKILGYTKSEFSDIAVYLSNQNELINVVTNLQTIYPYAKFITKEDQIAQLESAFDYNSGIFIALFIVSIFTFFMIVFDKTNAMSSSEKKEIGILKALGWRVEDILRTKFYEAVGISVVSYISGVLLALAYVYFFNGYYIKDMFSNIVHLPSIEHLQLSIDMEPLMIVFFLSVPVYIAATIIPAWKVATRDADEVMR